MVNVQTHTCSVCLSVGYPEMALMYLFPAIPYPVLYPNMRHVKCVQHSTCLSFLPPERRERVPDCDPDGG